MEDCTEVTIRYCSKCGTQMDITENVDKKHAGTNATAVCGNCGTWYDLEAVEFQR